MKNITLEDLLQKHFGLKGNLVLKSEIVTDDDYVDDSPDLELRHWTLDGLKAYGAMVDFLYDLGEHVKLHVDKRLGMEIIRLVDTFDEYEHDSN